MIGACASDTLPPEEIPESCYTRWKTETRQLAFPARIASSKGGLDCTPLGGT